MVDSRGATDANPLLAEAETNDERQRRLTYETQRLEASEASIGAGRLVPMSAVSAWIDSIDTPNELPPPRAR